MVSYSEWTEIGHEVYQIKGGDYPVESTATEITQTLATYWNNNTATLKAASKPEARKIAKAEMKV